MPEPLATPREIARLLACGVSTIYRLCERGVLPTVTVPGTSLVRIRRERVEALLREWERKGGRRGRGK